MMMMEAWQILLRHRNVLKPCNFLCLLKHTMRTALPSQ